MGTGSGFYDNETMELGRCPHCLVTCRFTRVTAAGRPVQVSVDTKPPAYIDDDSDPSRTFEFFQCPNCCDVIVWMATWRTCMADRGLERVFPVRADHPPAPTGTPPAIAKAYEEAVRVLPLSPNAAAALARRALQTIMREVVGVPPGNVAAEINAARDKLPEWLIDGLHRLRETGNFALHPDKDALTGEIVDTLPDEAALTVTLVEALLQHQFAGRDAAQLLGHLLAARRAEALS